MGCNCCDNEFTGLKITVKSPLIGVNLLDENRLSTAKLSHRQF